MAACAFASCSSWVAVVSYTVMSVCVRARMSACACAAAAPLASCSCLADSELGEGQKLSLGEGQKLPYHTFNTQFHPAPVG